PAARLTPAAAVIDRRLVASNPCSMKRLSAVSRIRCLVAAGARELASGTTLSRDAAVGASNGAFRSDIDFFREDFESFKRSFESYVGRRSKSTGKHLALEAAARARLPSATKSSLGRAPTGLPLRGAATSLFVASAFDRAAPRALNWSDCRGRRTHDDD